ncbi:MAG: type VI immunity family protein [Paracoccaceae bacterium]
MARYLTDQMLEATRNFDGILMADQNGHVSGKIVFKTVLFFEGGGTLEGQLRGLEALSYLAEGIEPHLTHMQTADPNAPITTFNLEQFKANSQAAIEQGQAKGEFDLDAGFFGSPFTIRNGGVGAFGGSISAGGQITPEHGDLSYLEVSTTLMWDAANDFQTHITRTLEAAKILKPRHGLAGFGVQFDRIYESTTSHGLSFPYLKRFPGLHCGADSSFVVESTLRRPTTDRIFTTNWLTLLADDLVGELGGNDALTAAIGPGCDLHKYDGGVMLQAGPYPQPGDANQGIMLKNYQSVARATAPIRFEDYVVGLLVAPPPLKDPDETLAWIRRFD